MNTAVVATDSGLVIATLDGDRVTIEQNGVLAGTGRWTGSRVEDCDARLGHEDGSQTEIVYSLIERHFAAA